ncbi:MAG TPA: NrsF family protein [Anaeromyxobacteraceae bacterium]|nr:NrsF family protein [Anaeromyxobacteraceae bacterium]
MRPTSSMKQRVLAAAQERPSASRGRALPGWLAAGAAALAMAVVYVAWGDPWHAAGRPATVGAWMVVGLLALAATVSAVVLPGRRSMLAPPTARLLAVAAGVPVIVGAWLVGWHAAYPDPFAQFGVRCFVLTLALAPWPFVALVGVASRVFPDRPRSLGAALGSAAGAWAAAVVELWCPLADPRHVTIGHVLPLVVLVGAGTLVGPRILRARIDRAS